ncbi:helix-turn-helix transcriptional regulator [Caulobacter sp. 73W]|uniref:Helix-turn-helix transcriptional regulator n=1 Tax=Caulobacter sp. 73W TaxID=3161137 RepID=A0AB39KRK2_9CAUL
MTAVDVAERMGIPVRTYRSFELGKGPFTFEKIRRFAEATDSDAMGIVSSLIFGSPDMALRCMDNKAATVLAAAFRAFGEGAGDQLAVIDPGSLIRAFDQTFNDLTEHLKRRDKTAERWLEENVGKLYGDTPVK